MSTIVVVNATSRTAKYLIGEALTKGIQVKAVVRSASKFQAQLEYQDRLSVHELADFNDVVGMKEIAQGATAVFITLAPADTQFTTLVQDVTTTVVAAIRSTMAASPSPTHPCPTKVILLSAILASPFFIDKITTGSYQCSLLEHILRTQALIHMYDDLKRTQSYLEKQSSWLRWTVLTPGQIVDVAEEPFKRLEYKLSTTEIPEAAISYRRVASAMLSLIENEQSEYDQSYVSPLPTTPVPVRLSDMASLRSTFLQWMTPKVGFACQVIALVWLGYIFSVTYVSLF